MSSCSRRRGVHQQSWHLWRSQRVLLLVSSCVGHWPPCSVPGGKGCNDLAHVDSRRLSHRSRRRQLSRSTHFILPVMRDMPSTLVMAQDSRRRGDIGLESRMVRQMVPRSSQYDIHQRKQFRRRLGQDSARTWRSRVRETILGSPIPFPRVAPQRISQKGSLVCVLHLAIPSPTGRAEHALSMCGQPTSLQNSRRGCDAQASRERTGIGGWLPLCDESGRINTARSPWFSLEITSDMLPWVFAKGDKPALVIATLEALAVVVSFRAFYGRRVPDKRTRVTVAPTWTDNRGNGAALNKLMSTKYPVSAVLVELASYMKEQSSKGPRGVVSPLRQTRGRPTCERSRHRFYAGEPSSHRPCTLIPLHVQAGRGLQFQRAKTTGALPNRGVRNRRRRAEDKLTTARPVVASVLEKSRLNQSSVVVFRCLCPLLFVHTSRQAWL